MKNCAKEGGKEKMRYVKAWLFSVAISIFCGDALAQSADQSDVQMRQAVQELMTRIKTLEADKARTDEKIRALEQSQAAAPKDAAPAKVAGDVSKAERPNVGGEAIKDPVPGFFKVPGTETSLKIGGFAALDIVQDYSGGGMGGAVAQPMSIVFGDNPQSKRNDQLSMTARRSRFNLQTLTPSSIGDVGTFLEVDFMGQGGNELVTNSSTVRMRHAYVTIGSSTVGSSWLAGQTWTNFVDLGTYPETVDFQGGHGMLQGIRQPQLRYTNKWDSNEFSVAIENPETDLYGMTVVGFNASVGPVPTTSVDALPDLTLRYAYAPSWGRIAMSALGRRLSIDNRGQAAINGFVGTDHVFAGGAGIAGKIYTFGKDSIQFNLNGGRGMGRYVLGTPIPTSAAIVDNQLESVKIWGASLGYQRRWTSTVRSNLTFGTIEEDLPRSAVPETVANRVDALFLNTIWEPVKRLAFGVEYVRGEVRNDAQTDNKGSADRLGFTVQAAF
ncbi:MAG: hypothetical protein JWQ90_4120 [Hydrocarboniphaga sp.]|uniref:DcaP family trimeric outer membrane transporter n=1 Tax=Hydrocarboniphaga sp. TaxID=2033016 RepID=UPI002633CA32|nr:DcaP family trimeric outer membrane transporter [Hydrocarboniphaga sp.]MDB5971670.1 hypothetical protein [Hydrocarboniphaga sp.]